MLDLSGLTDKGPLEYAVEVLLGPLMERGDGAFSILPYPPRPAEGGAGPAPGSHPDWSPIPNPLLRTRIEAASGYARRKRKKTEEYHDLLFLLARGGEQAGALKR
jgi:hypothetical protein